MTDVVVVGGGPAGAATAHALASRGLDVLVVDRSDFPRDKTCGDALTPRAVRVVERMGLLPELMSVGEPIHGYQVVAPNGRPTRGAIPATSNTPDLALVVRRHELDARLLARAQRSGARFEPDLHVTAVEATATVVRVAGERTGRAVSHTATMAVVATGASMGLLRTSGILKAVPRTMLAARSYVAGVGPAIVRDLLQLRFDAAPLPGYGWVFPVAPDAANVGIGFFPTRRSAPTTRVAYEHFIGSPFPIPIRPPTRHPSSVTGDLGICDLRQRIGRRPAETSRDIDEDAATCPPRRSTRRGGADRSSSAAARR